MPSNTTDGAFAGLADAVSEFRDAWDEAQDQIEERAFYNHDE